MPKSIDQSHRAGHSKRLANEGARGGWSNWLYYRWHFLVNGSYHERLASVLTKFDDERTPTN